MPYSKKKSKGRKTTSVKKSQKKSAPKSRKPPSVGSVRDKLSKHHGRMSAHESLSNVSEKPGFKYAGTQAYVSINKDQLKAIRKYIFDMCDTKNEDKVKLTSTFSKSLKNVLYNKIKSGYTFKRSELQKFPKLVKGKVEASSNFNSNQIALVSKLRQYVVPLYADKAFFKERIKNALDKLENILIKESKSTSARTSSSESPRTSSSESPRTSSSKSPRTSSSALPNRAPVRIKTIKVHKTTTKNVDVNNPLNNSGSNTPVSNTVSNRRRGVNRSNSNSQKNGNVNFQFNTNSANNLEAITIRGVEKLNCDLRNLCNSQHKTSAKSIVNVVLKTINECSKNKTPKYRSELKKELKNELNKI